MENLLEFIHSQNEYLFNVFHMLGFLNKIQSAVDPNLHLFIQQIFVEVLKCAMRCSRHWEYMEGKTEPVPALYSL